MAIALSLGPGCPPKVHDLLEVAKATSLNAYNPYSGYRVGAAVETGDGSRFNGTFMENASFGMTVCAEVAAVLASNSAGYRDIIRIAVVGGRPSQGGPGSAFTPCGRCRQVLWETSRVNGREIEVYCADLSLANILLTTSGELLPLAWGEDMVGSFRSGT
jgi:cytidine deaminase